MNKKRMSRKVVCKVCKGSDRMKVNRFVDFYTVHHFMEGLEDFDIPFVTTHVRPYKVHYS